MNTLRPLRSFVLNSALVSVAPITAALAETLLAIAFYRGRKMKPQNTLMSLVIAGMLAWFSPWGVTEVRASGNITGQIAGVTVKGGLPLDVARATVYLLDATNAVIKSKVLSTPDGLFDSGPLSAGTYKIRVAEGFNKTSTFLPQYYGSDLSQDVFDLGTAVSVADGRTESLPLIKLLEEIPSTPPECAGFVGGIVTDAVTGATLIGISVSAVNSINAMPLTEVVTAELGYSILYKGPCVLPKVRFSDPEGRYLPEYSGAGGLDDFSLGAVIDWRDAKVSLSESLAALSPAQAVENIVLQVMVLGLAGDGSLTGGLDTAVKLVSDANPNNDRSSCNILDAFTKRVAGRLNGGSLTQAEADVLVQSAQAAKSAIGCL